MRTTETTQKYIDWVNINIKDSAVKKAAINQIKKGDLGICFMMGCKIIQ